MMENFREEENIIKMNSKIMLMLSNYLSNYPDFIQEDIINEIVDECHVSTQYAFAVLLAAACGLNIDENKADTYMFQQYFIPMIQKLDNEIYVNNAYYQDINFPTVTIGACELKYEDYKPYEAFVYNDLITKEDGRMLPQIGFFTKEFSYPSIQEQDRIWMTITPNEIETMKDPIEQAFGHVLTYGLGLGYYAYMVSLKDTVTSITIVEQNDDVIALFKRYILPQFKNVHKLKIIKADAFEYASKAYGNANYDFVFTDLWHDVSDGIDMYIKMKEYERLSPDTIFMYWIEKSIKCYL